MHLPPGRSELRVADGAGHEARSTVHYWPKDTPPPPPAEPLAELRSSNPKSPAVFIAAPVREQWPFYFEFDGSADNTFDEFANSERARVAEPYKQIVCAGAGIKGGPDLAKGVYGANTGDADKVRAAKMLQAYCQGGAQLPAAAPKTPF